MLSEPYNDYMFDLEVCSGNGKSKEWNSEQLDKSTQKQRLPSLYG